MTEIPKKGNIKKIPLPYIINNLREEKATGMLIFQNPPVEKRLFIKDGYIIFASSNIEDDRLGDVLLSLGKINKEQFDLSTRLIKETGKRQGQIFLEQKLITAKELLWAVKYQIKEIIISIFLFEKGEYEFIPGELPMDEVITLDISTGNIIIEGIKRINDFGRIREGLPSLDSIPAVSSNPLNIFQDIKLAGDEEKILLLVNGKNRLKDICNISEQNEFNALRSIYLLYAIGFLAEKKEGEEKAKEAIEIKEEAAKPEADSLDIKKIHGAYLNLKDQNNYELLGVREDAAEAEIRKAYFRLAKEYHPDRHLQKEMSELKNELESLFGRITEAYNILIDEEKKREYDMSLATRLMKHKEKEESREDSIYKARAQFIIGKKNMDKGNHWGAADAFRWATRLDPHNAQYFSYLGYALSHIPRRLHEAEESCKKAISIEPSNPEHYINIGRIYKKAGLENKAKDSFEEALRWEPENEAALTELGRKGGSGLGFLKGIFSTKK
ncbi:MAG: DUF4388 domain-containing protein [Nitrospirota bacterium]